MICTLACKLLGHSIMVSQCSVLFTFVRYIVWGTAAWRVASSHVQVDYIIATTTTCFGRRGE